MKVRIKFSKHGVLKYVGHLDFMRYFQKAFRRTDIDVVYSKGFSPHMIISFAQPLGVGVESDGEYFDVEVNDNENVDLFVQKLNEQMAEGVEVLEAIVLPEKAENAMASVAAAAYEIEFYKDAPLTEKLIKQFIDSPTVEYVKKTKTGERTINIKDFVFDIRYLSMRCMYICVDASSGGNLKPATLCDALLKLDNKNIEDYPFHVTRKDTYKRNENSELVPLNKF